MLVSQNERFLNQQPHELPYMHGNPVINNDSIAPVNQSSTQGARLGKI